jgi:hypothetical protein
MIFGTLTSTIFNLFFFWDLGTDPVRLHDCAWPLPLSAPELKR